uniref:Uncharacterized protein n=1 Tax=Arundo donax TaxID=35708 RepID=A0A0A9SFH4_ARUDO
MTRGIVRSSGWCKQTSLKYDLHDAWSNITTSYR